MSDAIILEIIKTVGAIAAPVLLLWMNAKLNRMHKQFNSRMDEALIVKEDLGFEKGKAQEKAENLENKSKPK